MSRSIEISRDEAELLDDLLEVSDNYFAYDLRHQIREVFGMSPIDDAKAVKNDALSLSSPAIKNSSRRVLSKKIGFYRLGRHHPGRFVKRD